MWEQWTISIPCGIVVCCHYLWLSTRYRRALLHCPPGRFCLSVFVCDCVCLSVCAWLCYSAMCCLDSRSWLVLYRSLLHCPPSLPVCLPVSACLPACLSSRLCLSLLLRVSVGVYVAAKALYRDLFGLCARALVCMCACASVCV